MIYPIRGVKVSTPYGERGSYWSCEEDSKGNGIHTGVDFAAGTGTNIYAPIAGQIRHRNYGSAFGTHQFAISPDSGQPFGDGEVFFAHTSSRLADGTRVHIGDKIAHVGAEGNVSGPHLHMEYHPDTKNTWNCGVIANPQPVLDFQGDRRQPPTPDEGGILGMSSSVYYHRSTDTRVGKADDYKDLKIDNDDDFSVVIGETKQITVSANVQVTDMKAGEYFDVCWRIASVKEGTTTTYPHSRSGNRLRSEGKGLETVNAVFNGGLPDVGSGRSPRLRLSYKTNSSTARVLSIMCEGWKR